MDCEHCHHAHLIPAFLSVSHDMLQCAAQEDMGSVHLQPPSAPNFATAVDRETWRGSYGGGD